MSASAADGKDFPLEQFRRNVRKVHKHTLSRALSLWQSGLAIPAVAQQIGSVVTGGQIATSQLAQVYASKHLGAKFAPFTPGPSILDRPGVDKTYEYMRPAREPHPLAERQRLATLVSTDLQLAKTRTFYSAFDEDLNVNRSPIKIFKRVPGGENPCALCEIAADQVYFSDDLLPIHDNCQCDIEEDSGERLSEHQLRRHHIGFVETLINTGDQQSVIKDLADHDAPPSAYHNLVAVHDHGELGPVLAWKGQKFTGPGDLPVAQPPRPDPTITTTGPAHEARIRQNAARIEAYRRTKARKVFRVAKPKGPSLGRVQVDVGPGGQISVGPLERPNVIPMRKAPNTFDWEGGELREGLSYMRDKFAGRVHPLTFGSSAGWGSTTFPAEAQRATLQAIDDMLTKHPDTHVDWFEIRDLGPNSVAETEADLTTPGRTTAMRFDRQVMKRTPAQMREAFKRSQDSGFYFKGASENPYRSMVTHEFGHVLDNRGGWAARRSVTQDVMNLYFKSPQYKALGADPDQFENLQTLKRWLQTPGRVSGYSMRDMAIPGDYNPDTGLRAGMALNPAEAIAQAFEDVERRGEGASDVSKMLHRRVVEEAQGPIPEEYQYVPRKASLSDRAPASEQVARLKQIKMPWTEAQWAKEDNAALSPEQRATARQLAEDIYQKAISVEPAVTKATVAAVRQRGGYMSGLDFRLKTGPSLYRKIQAEFIESKGSKTFTQIAGEIKDSVRYTAIFPAEGQWESGDKLRKALESLGAKTIKDPIGIPLYGYRGRNLAFRLHGVDFEMQINTPLGAAIKDENHRIYEDSRKLRVKLIDAGKDPDTDPEYKALFDKMQVNWDALPITKGTPVVQTENDVRSGDINKVLYTARSTMYRGPSIPGGESALGSAEMLARERVPSTEYGMTWMPDTGWARVVQRARAIPNDEWERLPVQELPQGTPILANEGHLKKKSIDKVVSGAEPFRSNYVIKLWRDDDGNLHVVDGHTRIAMYHALGLNMPVRIMDEDALKTLETLRIPGQTRGPLITSLKGEPTTVGRAPELTRTAYDTAKANGGITIDLAGNQPVEGYAYAPRKDTELAIPLGNLTPEDIDKYIDDHFDLLSTPGNHLGLWEEKGDMYLDVSRVGPPTPETIAEAQANNQLGVFDLKSFDTINIGKIDERGNYDRLGSPSDIHAEHRRQVEGTAESRSAPSVSEIPRGGP